MNKVFVIDNYDSFTYNLVHYLKEFNVTVKVCRNDKFEMSDLLSYNKILLSPGPGIPEEAGKLKEVIRTYAKTKSILGICLGMQLLVNSSDENGIHKGLGIIPGKIKELEGSDFHIGWNNIEICKRQSFIKKFNNHEFFFNHGFAFQGNTKNILSKTLYGKNLFASSIIKNNTIGFQFHPEKSQKAGLQLLKSTVRFLTKNK